MGSRIAARLLAAGNEVHGWNRTPGKVTGGLIEEVHEYFDSLYIRRLYKDDELGVRSA